jgi:hypothetical protein
MLVRRCNMTRFFKPIIGPKKKNNCKTKGPNENFASVSPTNDEQNSGMLNTIKQLKRNIFLNNI